MSTTNPPSDDGQPEQQGPEYLEQGAGDPVAPERGSGGGRRTALVAGGAVVLLAAAGAGTWAAMSFLGSGTSAAEALPADTLAYASVDLDPSGSQKVEAFRMIEKFPALKKELGGFDADDDIRRKIFQEADCEGLDYDADVAPWIGNSFAIAAVDAGGEQPSPVGVLEVTDAGAAEDGLATLARCGGQDDGEGEGGFVVEGDWAYYADSEEIAQQVADAAAEGTLADDADHQQWTDEVGDAGVVAMYAAPDAGPVIADLMASEMGAQGASASSVVGDGTTEPALATPEQEVPEEMLKAFEDFGGAAATVRFDDGGMELELAGDLPQGTMLMTPGDEAPADLVGTLPADTALAYGLALPDGWAQALLDKLPDYGVPQEQIDQGLAQAEAQTGLSLPGDLETLLGDQFALAVGRSFDLEQLMNSGDPSGLPLGVKVRGDADGINGVMDTLGQSSGMPEMFETETDGDAVAWSLDPDYRGALAAQGGLGDSETFQDVVPDAADSSAVLFVDFDAGDWLTGLSMGDQEVRDNLEPLSALGVSSRVEDGTTRGLVRLTTD